MEEIKNFVNQALRGRRDITVGLGSGSAARMVAEELGFQARMDGITIMGIPSSTQIALAASSAGFIMLSPSELDRLDIVVDGADQFTEGGMIIKGGGGALGRERVLWEASDNVHVFIKKERMVKDLSLPLPVEFLPFSMYILKKLIEKKGMHATLRTNEKGYPLVSENGNFLFDVSYKDARQAYYDLRGLPGVLDVGLFIYDATVHLL
ncbi:MAG: ribose 5-phosphate isomerase A [Nitrososphaerota archaeon]|nr:ribose 5-phosphate isomerase A [Nitrososphaerota archaeon]MDG7036146.1 ribose 5-phosphate isomerase A [Nitrososphaerota archaeon]MDG7037788.1 ribose 5-phosphate isomerase A [Nitrososphaerota archaeon]MDG7045472.1 ribose 5-phosphate isomerase A [Nitrososphaerota archaeon]